MNKSSSGSVNSVVRLHFAESQQSIHLDLREKRPADADRTRLRRPDAPHRDSLPDAAGADHRETSLVSAVFNYLMESFALAGASLYPTAHFPVEAYFAREQQRDTSRPALREAILSAPSQRRLDAAVEKHGSHANRRRPGSGFAPANMALSDDRELPSPAIAPSNHWSWLTSSWGVFDTLWAHWRSEREIRKAIDALAELDDRTLRDLGIPHRSQIEYTVRYCRNC